jgi:hypothetical protein
MSLTDFFKKKEKKKNLENMLHQIRALMEDNVKVTEKDSLGEVSLNQEYTKNYYPYKGEFEKSIHTKSFVLHWQHLDGGNGCEIYDKKDINNDVIGGCEEKTIPSIIRYSDKPEEKNNHKNVSIENDDKIKELIEEVSFVFQNKIKLIENEKLNIRKMKI